MSESSTQFIRIPPDSTGKRIAQSAMMSVLTAGVASKLASGTLVVGETSDVRGYVFKHHDALSNGNSIVELILLSDSPQEMTPGENLLVAGSAVGTSVDAGTAFYMPRNLIVGGNNPHNAAFVSDDGSLLVKQTNLDAFNRVQMGTATRLGEYIFTYNNTDEFEDVIANGAEFEHHPEYAGMVLRASGDAGSKVQRTTHLYHRYQAGFSQLIMMTVSTGDSGKANNVRRWGYYDDNDGIFFELNGTQMYAVVRSSVTGSVVETRIPQSQWSHERLNGQGGTLSGGIQDYVLDVTKDNIYWIDLQWLGAGTVRFGIFHNGKRVTCHEQHNDGRHPVSYMRTGSLPLRWESLNTGMTGSTSELTAFCASVLCEGNYEPSKLSFGRAHVGTETITSNTAWFVVSSMRMKELFKGRTNRAWGIPREMHLYSDQQPIQFAIIKNGTLSNVQPHMGQPETPWSRDPHDDSATEFDYANRSITGGQTLVTLFVGAGKPERIDLDGVFSTTKERVKRHANASEFDTYSFCVKLFKAGTTDVELSLNWDEVH